MTKTVKDAFVDLKKDMKKCRQFIHSNDDTSMLELAKILGKAKNKLKEFRGDFNYKG